MHAARALFDDAPEEQATRRFLAEPTHHLLVAYDEADTPMGFVSGVELTHPDKGTEMFLYELGVDESARRRGVGRTLVQALAALAREQGCYDMWVSPTPTTRPRRRPTRAPRAARPRGRCCWSGCSSAEGRPPAPAALRDVYCRIEGRECARRGRSRSVARSVNQTPGWGRRTNQRRPRSSFGSCRQRGGPPAPAAAPPPRCGSKRARGAASASDGRPQASGISACRRVPRARRAVERERAVERRDAVGEAAQARAARGVGAADAVVGDVDGDAPVRRAAPRRSPASPGRTWRRSRAPRRRRSRRRSRPAPGRRSSPSASTVTGTGRARRERLQRRLEARARSGPPGGCRARARAARRGSSGARPARGRAAPRARGPRPRACARRAAAARARPAATARRRAGRARAAGARRRRPRRAARATRAAPPGARAARRRGATTWLRSRPPRNANGISAVGDERGPPAPRRPRRRGPRSRAGT